MNSKHITHNLKKSPEIITQSVAYTVRHKIIHTQLETWANAQRDGHRSRIRYLRKNFNANFNEFSEIKKIRKNL